MAFLYKRKRSPFWWVNYRDPSTGNREQKSTGFRHGIESETRKARQVRDEYSMQESAANTEQHPWRSWVVAYLKVRHASSPRTLQRKMVAWRTMESFLEAQRVYGPHQLTREHCFQFIEWRSTNGFFQLQKAKPVKFNTALLDLKVLSNVMWEGVHRGYVKFNPCQRLGLKKQRPAEKDEMSDDQVRFIRSEIARKLRTARTDDAKRNADFLHVSFEIALAQGWRLHETHLPLADFNLVSGMVRVRTKGDKMEEVPINPALLPLLRRLAKKGRHYTYDPPRMPSLNWWKFFDDMRGKRPDLKRVSLHSTRVSWTSRVERAGMPETVAMKMLGHSSTTVHRVYRRVKRQEVAPYWAHVSFPAASASQPYESESQDSGPRNPKRPGRGSAGRG